ncbi:MAG: cupredoxin domain-containing protein [Candidatus Thermoplasmatota archaeon]
MLARFAAVVVLLAAISAGCLTKDEPSPAITAASVPALSVSHPSFTKFSFSTNITSPTDPVDALLGRSHEAARTFEIPVGVREARVAIDVQPTAQDKAPIGDVKVRMLDSGGVLVFESALLTKSAKFVPILTAPAAGTYSISVTYRGVWGIGVVVVTTPADYTPGIVLNVSSIEQTRVEHTFYPSVLTAQAGAPTRLTLYDYDPHAGVGNLQHNIVIPALDVKTDGRTTWGEVRTLDFKAPTKTGTYEFYCEFHKSTLNGTITVV